MRTFTALLVVLVGSTQVPALAHAKCAPGPVADRLAAGEIVFQGRLVGMKEIRVDREIVDDYQGRGRESSGWLGEFQVEKVWKGSVGSTISVLTNPVGCGRPFGPVGTSAIVPAGRAGPYWVAPWCSGIRSNEERTALDLLGPPSIQYPTDATRDLAAGADVDPPGPSSPSLVGMGFLAGTAVASLVLAWSRGRRPRV